MLERKTRFNGARHTSRTEGRNSLMLSPQVPRDLAVALKVNDARKISLTWTVANPLSKVEVWRRTTGASALVATVDPAVATYEEAGQAWNQAHTYKLREKLDAAFSEFSDEVAVTTPVEPLYSSAVLHTVSLNADIVITKNWDTTAAPFGDETLFEFCDGTTKYVGKDGGSSVSGATLTIDVETGGGHTCFVDRIEYSREATPDFDYKDFENVPVAAFNETDDYTVVAD